MLRWCYHFLNINLLTILILAGISGCATHSQQQSTISKYPVKTLKSVNRVNKVEAIPIPEKLPCRRLYQDEILYLKQMLAEKDELIRRLNIRESDQAQELQKTSSEISRTQNKLHRLATQPEAASKMAEVEVAIATLEQSNLTKSNIAFKHLAQRFLNAAMVVYRQKDYSQAMNYAAQSGELISAINSEKDTELQDAIVPFRTPIFLRTIQVDNLRAEPNSTAKVVNRLKLNVPLTVSAYYHEWLYVQVSNNLSGWIQSSSVDVQFSNRRFKE